MTRSHWEKEVPWCTVCLGEGTILTWDDREETCPCCHGAQRVPALISSLWWAMEEAADPIEIPSLPWPDGDDTDRALQGIEFLDAALSLAAVRPRSRALTEALIAVNLEPRLFSPCSWWAQQELDARRPAADTYAHRLLVLAATAAERAAKPRDPSPFESIEDISAMTAGWPIPGEKE